MTDSADLAGITLPVLDLVDSPFTDAGSRLLVTRTGNAGDAGAGLAIRSAEYERPADECRVLRALVIRSATGSVCPVERADAAVVEFAGGPSLVFADDVTLSLGFPDGRWRVELHVVGDPELGGRGGTASTDLAGGRLAWQLDVGVADQSVTGTRTAVVVIDIDAGPPGSRASASGARLLLREAGGPAPAAPAAALPDPAVPAAAGHAELRARAHRRWRDWFERMPRVRADLAETARLAWWVLRANQLRVRHDPSRLMVVPSKFGYVGAWQWDSYFVTAGLRHGAPELAWDQTALFLDHQLANGLIPDVVSDDGILASADDLPPGDVVTLTAHLGADAGVSSGTVPVTKPPLTAWALCQLHRLHPDTDRLAWALPRIERSQRWWIEASDTNADGLPEYLHPYSSGLDDSPLFDLGVPAETPDLGSYLTVQDDLLGGMARLLGDEDAAAAHQEAAAARVRRMLDLRWDAAARRFRAYGAGQELPTFTPFHLMPLLTGRLPDVVVGNLVDSMRERLWGQVPPAPWPAPTSASPHPTGAWPLPTVAYDEPTFDADRMWRGPVWINVNRLVTEGLLRSGRPDLARELAERTLAMVAASSGMYEYWNSLTGQRPPRATTSFAWSAALFIDLAVAVTDDLGLLGVVRPDDPP